MGFTSGTIAIDLYGNWTVGSLSFGQACPIVQHAGLWEIKTEFELPRGVIPYEFEITNYQFTNTAAWTIRKRSKSGYVKFSGQPVFWGNIPNWTLDSSELVGARWDLNGFKMEANSIQIIGSGGTQPNGRHSYLYNRVATGEVETPTLQIGSSGYPLGYLDLQNCTVTLTGAGTIYNNLSLNNAGDPLHDGTPAGPFDIRQNTVFEFAPAGGTANLNSGSDDRDSQSLDPADWEDNFAFDVIRIAQGAAITLTGGENIGGGTHNALYARRIEGLGSGGTLVLNGRNVYLLEQPQNVTFDVTGGGTVYYPPRGTIVTVR